MAEELNESVIQNALDFAYDQANEGFACFDSAQELAKDYMEEYPNDKLEQADALIRWQIAKSATSGFVSNLGGLMTLPFAIPANIASVLFVQIRMIMAIAIIGGHNPKNDQVKALIYSSLVGSGVKELLKETGIIIGQKIALNAIRKYLTGSIIVRINRAVGFRLLTKFGSTGVINLAKGIPLLGGLIGGTVDAVWTNEVGEAAKSCFIEG
jgi:hypothetical protein